MSCMYSEKGLDLDTAIGILENVEEYAVIIQPPIKPKGGEVFVFLPQDINEQDNYKCDQYRWLNSGPKEIPRKNPLVKKQYFIGKLPQGKTQAFQKHCYVLVGDHRSPHPVLIHYIGDETVMVDYPHGNSKKSNSAYFAIAPSVRRDIAHRSKNALPTAIINSYKANSSCFMKEEDDEKYVNPVLTPRNKSQVRSKSSIWRSTKKRVLSKVVDVKIQVRNIRRKQRLNNKKEGIPAEDLTTLHSLGAELLGFCHYIRTFPELACIVGLNELSLEVENLMKLNNNVVVFSFHETYKVGRYFISPFNCIHSAFSELPAIPCYFLISETCDFFMYEKYLLSIVDCIPSLEECQTAVITNQDYNFTSALTVAFPNWTQVYDWEILFAAARSFLRKLHVDIKDISMRIRQLKSLMSCETLEDYRVELERLKKDWPLAFCEYYAQVLQEPIEIRLGRWQLERYKLFSPQLGVHRGMNSDLQLVIKHLQELKDVSLDVILPSLYHLQVYIYVAILKGFCGLGKLRLSSPFKFLKRDIDELVLPAKVYEPNGIVRIFRVRGITMFSENIDSLDEENALLQAQRIVEMGHISHSTDLTAFLVKSTSGSLHGVQLFPRESCSCSINQRCSHIMAVMLALGMPLTYDKKGTIKVINPQVNTTGATSPECISLLVINKQIPSNTLQLENTSLHDENEESMDIEIEENEEQQQQQQLQEQQESLDGSTNACVTDATNTYMQQNNVVTSLTEQHIQQQPSEQQLVQVSSSDLENVLNTTQGNEVLMVVSDGNENEPKPMIAYQVSQEAMMAAYAHAQLPHQTTTNISNVEIVGVPKGIELTLAQTDLTQNVTTSSPVVGNGTEVLHGTLDGAALQIMHTTSDALQRKKELYKTLTPKISDDMNVTATIELTPEQANN